MLEVSEEIRRRRADIADGHTQYTTLSYIVGKYGYRMRGVFDMNIDDYDGTVEHGMLLSRAVEGNNQDTLHSKIAQLGTGYNVSHGMVTFEGREMHMAFIANDRNTFEVVAYDNAETIIGVPIYISPEDMADIIKVNSLIGMTPIVQHEERQPTAEEVRWFEALLGDTKIDL